MGKGSVNFALVQAENSSVIKPGTKCQVRLSRSVIGRDQRVRGTVKALGLGRIGDVREHVASPALLGMLRRVAQVIEVTPIK